MRKLIDAVNIDAPSADYPKGRVRDKNGAILGTEYREVLHGDMIQFFQKLVIESGITENDLPDNVTNGYQLFEALTGSLGKWTQQTITNSELGTNTGTFSTGIGTSIIKYNVVGKKVTLQFLLEQMNHSATSVDQVFIDLTSFFPTGVVGTWVGAGRFLNLVNGTYSVGLDRGVCTTQIRVDTTDRIKITPMLAPQNSFYCPGANALYFEGQITFEIA